MKERVMDMKKGQFVVEPSIAISEFIEKINKLSYQNFPVDEVLKVLQKNPFSLALLEPYIFYSNARYTRNLIYKSSEFELLVLCWKSGQHSAIHGHEGGKCWMRVEHGSLQFTNFQEEPAASKAILRKLTTIDGKEGFIDGPAGIHQVSNVSQQNVVSLHLYARPFEVCDIYDLNTNQKTRMSLGYQSIHGKLVALE